MPISCLQDVKVGSSADVNMSSIVLFGRDGTAVEFLVKRRAKGSDVFDGHQRNRSRYHSKASYTSFRAGLQTDDVLPGVWCSRVAEELLWMAQEGTVWQRFAKYMRLGAERMAVGWNSGYMNWAEVTRRIDVDSDFHRLQVHDRSNWEATSLNVGYKLCSTYPQTLYLPKTLSDDDVARAAKERSRDRLPALVWLHPVTRVPLCRAAQPKSGLSGNMENDRKMCLAIQASSVAANKPLRIIDARPFINAQANALQGKGYENVGFLGGPSVASLAFLDIENVRISYIASHRPILTRGSSFY
jgi:hypothetical protein